MHAAISSRDRLVSGLNVPSSYPFTIPQSTAQPTYFEYHVPLFASGNGFVYDPSAPASRPSTVTNIARVMLPFGSNLSGATPDISSRSHTYFTAS